jgi:hypothetical protein
MTPRQRQTLVRLRKWLGSDGYLIYTVARRFRRTACDFVAVYKHNTRNFVLVQPARKHVVVRPFGTWANTTPAHQSLQDLLHFRTDPIRLGPQIPPGRRNLEVEHFLPPQARDELARLTT